MGEAPSAPKGSLAAKKKAETEKEDREIEAMLAQLRE